MPVSSMRLRGRHEETRKQQYASRDTYDCAVPPFGAVRKKFLVPAEYLIHLELYEGPADFVVPMGAGH